MNEFRIKLLGNNYLIQEHRIEGVRVLPCASYLDIFARCLKWRRFSLSQVTYPQMATLKEGESFFLVIRYNEQTKEIVIHHEKAAHIIYFQACVEEVSFFDLDMKSLHPQELNWVSINELYQRMDDTCIERGEFMRVLGRSQLNDKNVRMSIALSSKARPFLSHFYLHPALLDGASYSLAALHFEEINPEKGRFYLPFCIDRVDVYARINTEEVLVFAKRLPSKEETLIRCQVWIFSSSGHLLLVLNGLTNKRVERHLLFNPLPANQNAFQIEDSLQKTKEAQAHPLIFKDGFKELELFSYHLIKYKLISNGLIWNDPQSKFVDSFSAYRDYFIALMSQLKAFEKNQGSKLRNTIKTWDTLLQLRLNLSKKYPYLLPYLNVLAVSTEKLVAILRDEESIQTVLFPYGQDKLVRAIYQNNALVNAYNEMIATEVEKIRAKSATLLNVLEVGGGFGTTTAAVLQLCEEGIQYRFTDINPQLVLEAQEQFGHSPHFQAFVLDINTLNLPEPMDVIIATDVLSLADDVLGCLKAVAAHLKTKGVLMILESITNPLFLSASFGLLKRDSAFNGSHRISGSRLMTCSSWQWLLEYLGFIVTIHPMAEKLNQSIIFAVKSK